MTDNTHRAPRGQLEVQVPEARPAVHLPADPLLTGLFPEASPDSLMAAEDIMINDKQADNETKIIASITCPIMSSIVIL